MTAEGAAGESRLAAARRVVVKVGSALLVEASTGNANRPWLESLADDVAALRARGQEVVLVSSGAIALGRRELGLGRGKVRLEESQAAAAVGQISLAHAWKEVLERRGFTVAQVLLTLGAWRAGAPRAAGDARPPGRPGDRTRGGTHKGRAARRGSGA